MSAIIDQELDNMRKRLVAEVIVIVDEIFPAIEKTIIDFLNRNILEIPSIVVYDYDTNWVKVTIFRQELRKRIGNVSKLEMNAKTSGSQRYVFDLELELPNERGTYIY